MTITCVKGKFINDSRGYQILKMHYLDSVTGKGWYRSIHAPIGEADATTEAFAAAKTQARFVRDEPGDVWTKIIEEGGNSETLITGAQYNTPKEVAKYVIRQLMKSKDPLHVLACEALILYLQANFTTTAMATFLDTNEATILRINTRVNKILNNKVDINDFGTLDEAIP